MGLALEVCAFITSSLDYSKMQFTLDLRNLHGHRMQQNYPALQKVTGSFTGISLFLNSWQRTQQSIKDLSPY